MAEQKIKMSDGTQLTVKELGAELIGPGGFPDDIHVTEASTAVIIPAGNWRSDLMIVKGYGGTKHDAIIAALNHKAIAEVIRK